ncbi:MAG TPA: sialate O-acetylesterase [Thermoanaerobaculaceae bacterium]|nr:sialate O-acetylesterase [Thermoanaerobaculaceae bacterium]
MSVYPGAFDAAPQDYTDWTGDPALAPTTAVLDSAAVDLLFSALVAIETELGIDPAGASASVAARLTAIEAALSGAGVADGSITTAKLANLAVTAAKLADAAVTTAKLQDGSVTAAKVAADVATQAEMDAVAASLTSLAASLSSTYAPIAEPVALAVDAAAVHLAGAETVAGVKTFSSSPVVPTPTTSGQAATKGYVDSIGINPDFAGFDVILLAGQSNMVGLGTGTSTVRVDPLDSRVYIYEPGGTYRDTVTQSPGLNIVHAGGASSSIGPGHQAGIEMARMIPSNRAVLLVPMATSGSSFATGWAPPSGGLYTAAVAQTKKALATHDNNRIAAVLWHQGESSSGNTQAQYAASLDGLITAMRSDLGLPTLPFIVAGLVPEWITNGTGVVAGVEAALIDTPARVAYTAYVHAPHGCHNDVIGSANSIHFNMAGSRFLGRGYALGYRVALANSTPSPAAALATVGAVTGLTAVAPSNTVTVSWNNVMGAWNYLVEYSNNGGLTWTSVGTYPAAPVAVAGLAGTTAYRFRVTPRNGGGDGTPATVDITTGAPSGPVTGTDSTSFTAADGSGLPPTDQGRTWTTFATGGTASVPGIQSNRGYNFSGGTANPAGVWVDVAASDVTVQATFPVVGTTGQGIGLILSWVDASNYIYVDTVGIKKVIAGAFITPATHTGGGFVSGDVMKVTRSGTAVTCFKNGTQVSTATVADAVLTGATKHGWFIRASDGTSRIDDWSCVSP